MWGVLKEVFERGARDYFRVKGITDLACTIDISSKELPVHKSQKTQVIAAPSVLAIESHSDGPAQNLVHQLVPRSFKPKGFQD